MTHDTPDTLWSSGLDEFRDATASAAPTPGGGSVAGVSATLGIGLVIMALEITANRKDVQESGKIATLIHDGRALMDQLAADADADIAAFRAYMAALKLPKQSEEEKAQRKAALQDATRRATESPLSAARHMLEALRIASAAAPFVHLHVVSDIGAGAGLLEGALKAVLFNVDVNLPSLSDPAQRSAWSQERQSLAETGATLANEVLTAVSQRLAPAP